MALTITKSPTVLVPALISKAHMTIAAASPTVKITACPALSTASEV